MSSANTVVLIATILAALAAAGSWWLDQRRLACATRWRALPATLLLLLSVWVTTLIVATHALKVPGAYGPVQYWYSDAKALAFMSGPRTWAMFAVWGGVLLAPAVTITMFVSLFRETDGFPRRRMLLPVLALIALSATFMLFVTYRFYPSA